jgi:serine/threonine-protein kinase
LLREVGADGVFMDVDSLEPGVDFRERITSAVGECDMLLVLIGKQWLDSRSRLDDPEDFVRVEIETALARGIRVIPVLVNGAEMPRPDDLPESLRTVAGRHALELSNSRWRHDVDRLVRTIEAIRARRVDAPVGAAVAGTRVDWPVVPGYAVEAYLGYGPGGHVYVAKQEPLGRLVILRVFGRPEECTPEWVTRFKRDTAVWASLTHPNVLPVYDAGERAGQLFVSTAFDDGASLSDVLATSGPLDPARVTQLVAGVAAALDAAHARDLVHGGLRPGDVRVSGEDAAAEVRVGGFGVAGPRSTAGQLSKTAVMLGDIDYLSPESVRGEELGPWSDVYSLGAVTFEMLTGSAPFTRESPMQTMWAHFEAPRPAVSEHREHIPSSLDALVQRALAVETEARFASAREFAEAFTAAVR